MNRSATRCMLIALALTLPAVTALAEDADANGLLGKPTELLKKKVTGERFGPSGGRGKGLQLSPDGRWLIYWKPTKPLPEIEADGNERFMQRMQAKMNQPGEITLRDLKTGKEVNLLGKNMAVARKQATAFMVVDCLSPSGSHALITVLSFEANPDSPVGVEPPSHTDLYLVSLVEKPKARKIKIADKLAVGVVLAGEKKALLAATSNLDNPGIIPPLKLVDLTKEGSAGKAHQQKGIPVVAHPKKAIAAVYHPRRPKSTGDGPIAYDDEMQWHPTELHLVDANTGKTIQRPNIHPKHGDWLNAYFLGKTERIAYGDIDVIQEPGSEPDTGMVQKPAVRVWDMKKKTIVREFRNRTLIGPGPTESTLVIAKTSRSNQPAAARMGPPARDKMKLLLADIETGKTWPMTKQECTPLSARGGKIVYTVEKNGSKTYYVADVKLPAELEKRQKKSGK
jgi:hypothetical protein